MVISQSFGPANGLDLKQQLITPNHEGTTDQWLYPRVESRKSIPVKPLTIESLRTGLWIIYC